MKTHWKNPWDTAIPVPIEELAECHDGIGKTWDHGDGTTFIMTVEKVLQNWLSGGVKVDAYILPQADGWHSIGIRYGAEGDEYLSPHGNRVKVSALLAKYQGAKVNDIHPLQSFLEDAGFETRSYSGRGMYGKKCVAVELESENGGSLGDFVADCCEMAQINNRGDEMTEAEINENSVILASLRSLRTDSLGLGMIVYFPDVPYVEG